MPRTGIPPSGHRPAAGPVPGPSGPVGAEEERGPQPPALPPRARPPPRPPAVGLGSAGARWSPSPPGLLFATSGRTAQGTDLRAGEVTQLSELIDAAQRRRSPGRATSWPSCRRGGAADRAGRQPRQRRRGRAERRGRRGPCRGPRAGHRPGVEITLDDAPLGGRRQPAGWCPARRPGHPPVRRPGGRERRLGRGRRRRRDHGPAAHRHQRRPVRGQHPAAAGPHLLPAVRRHGGRRRRRPSVRSWRPRPRWRSSSRPSRPSG